MNVSKIIKNVEGNSESSKKIPNEMQPRHRKSNFGEYVYHVVYPKMEYISSNRKNTSQKSTNIDDNVKYIEKNPWSSEKNCEINRSNF